MSPEASRAMGRAVEMLDLCGYSCLAAHIAHWPSLQAYAYAREKVAWAREHAVDEEHEADCGMAIVLLEAAMAASEVPS